MQHLQSHALMSQVKKNFLIGYPKEVHYRFDKLELWQKLKNENCDEKTIFQALNVSRSTLFRWQKLYQEEELEGLKILSRKPKKIRIAVQQLRIKDSVFKMRKKYPLFGKYKIKVMI